MNTYTTNVYRMLIIKKSQELTKLAYEYAAIEQFNELYNEIQYLKNTVDFIEAHNE